MSSEEKQKGLIKLTGFGEFLVSHGVMTHSSWWQKQIKEIEKLRDEDYGYDVLMEERSRGFAKMAELFEKYGSPRYWPTKAQLKEIEENRNE